MKMAEMAKTQYGGENWHLNGLSAISAAGSWRRGGFNGVASAYQRNMAGYQPQLSNPLAGIQSGGRGWRRQLAWRPANGSVAVKKLASAWRHVWHVYVAVAVWPVAQRRKSRGWQRQCGEAEIES
jgi:hypothetical protein